ncbi:FadR/GntR family transcriptional regulator [Kitasatospora sp. NPDC092948]|uniref:FadR/GntR family transcriptional regulator n=1 Tax=Kitasatospora sp. NPDC092948 TaxID=3364088 RepID=UPI0037F92748
MSEPEETHTEPFPRGARTQTLSDRIGDRLIVAIAIGEYLPGVQLSPERELAAALGVGRVTVRAAIARLVDLGLLQKRRGRNGGTFVIGSDAVRAEPEIAQVLEAARAQLLDQYEAESWMHGAVAAAAAQRHTGSDRQALLLRLEEFRAAGSGPEAQAADELLHETIARAARSPALRDSLLALERRIHVRAPLHPWGTEATWQDMERRALRDHERLVEAILARDVAAAHEIGRLHARINIEHIEAVHVQIRTDADRARTA